MKKVAIIGAGLQASRRIPAIVEEGSYEVALIIDRKKDRADKAAAALQCSSATDWRVAIKDSTLDAVVVLTYPDSHAAITIAALHAGKDVLCEKPLAKTVAQAAAMVKAARQNTRILKCGFNHRHHPAVQEAYRLYGAGKIGQAVFGRGRYGIAGRPGLEQEWRSNPKIVSGGQLMEQGIHLIDLFRWFLGDFHAVAGMVSTSFWPISPLEDNGFALLQGHSGAIVSVHSSLTQWINLFSFEIYGERGSLTVEGLGGSYGVEKLITSVHDPTGPFTTTATEYRGGDRSWHIEWQEFVQAVKARRQPLGNGEDGLRAMELVQAVYRAARTGHTKASHGKK